MLCHDVLLAPVGGHSDEAAVAVVAQPKQLARVPVAHHAAPGPAAEAPAAAAAGREVSRVAVVAAAEADEAARGAAERGGAERGQGKGQQANQQEDGQTNEPVKEVKDCAKIEEQTKYVQICV